MACARVHKRHLQALQGGTRSGGGQHTHAYLSARPAATSSSTMGSSSLLPGHFACLWK